MSYFNRKTDRVSAARPNTQLSGDAFMVLTDSALRLVQIILGQMGPSALVLRCAARRHENGTGWARESADVPLPRDVEPEYARCPADVILQRSM